MQLAPAFIALAIALPPAPSFAGTSVGRPSIAVSLASSAPEILDVVEALQTAEQKANEDPGSGIEPLRDALARYEALGRTIARDRKAHEARTYAFLALARAYQALGQNQEAEGAMDEVIRVARGDAIPAKTFGPRLVELYEARLAAPENRPAGHLVVTCAPACDVLLNTRHAGSGARVELINVPIGSHRVEVFASDGSTEESLEQRIDLEDGETFALEWKIDEETIKIVDPDIKGPADTGPRRRLPRWAGIVGMATGAAAMIAGGVLLGFHGRCPDGSDPSAADACINVLNTRAPGIALLAVGGAAFAGFGVALIVGETKARKRGTSGAMLGYTLRF